MSVLTGKQIIDMGLVKNYDKNAIQPASVDVRLSNQFIKYDEDCILNPEEKPVYKFFTAEKIMIIPRGFQLKHSKQYLRHKYQIDKFIHGGVLGSTIEYVKVPENYVAIYTGRSSLGRMFVQSHQTAGLCDSGWEGRLTLEITAHDLPVILKAGMRIGQIYFMKLDDIPHEIYNGKYQKQETVIPTKIYKDFQRYNENEILKAYLIEGKSLVEICKEYEIEMKDLLSIFVKRGVDINNVKRGSRLNRLLYDIKDIDDNIE